MQAITIGCDPEVFIRDRASGEFASAHGVIPGSKEKPYPVTLGAVQVDGMACEFNTNPATTRQEFIRNVTGVFKSLSDMLPEEFELVPGVPVAKFTPEIFKSQPLEALELGCEPDYNAYTMQENPRPISGDDRRMRTAAGHIHIGFTEQSNPFDPGHMADCFDLVSLLDCTVGIMSVAYDSDVERRSLYGSAGAFRPKTYGVEYRVLSNAWLRSEHLMGEVYDSVVQTTEMFLQGARIPEDYAEEAQDIINNSRVEEAAKFLEKINSYFGE